MKMLNILTVFSLVCLAGAAWAGDPNLPLDKRISMERLLLIEEYQTALLKCREHTRKTVKDSCIEKRKDFLAKTFDDLKLDPKAYFINKDRNKMSEGTAK